MQHQSQSVGSTDSTVSEMNTFKSVVTVLADPNAKDDIKLKAAQELIKNFEVVLIAHNMPLNTIKNICFSRSY